MLFNQSHSTVKLLIKEKFKITHNLKNKVETVLVLPQDIERRREGGLRTKGYSKKSYKNRPIINIITVVFNGEKHIENSIRSVINQTYDNIEYIIIDGGSTDKTIDIIMKYDNVIDYWVSEKDDGIYDAMNKAIMLCQGDYVYFLGADDIIINGAINNLLQQFNYNILSQLIVFPVLIDGNKIAKPNISLPIPVIHHQGALFNLSNLKQIGLYSDKYKLHSDFDLMSKYIKKYGIKYTNNPICRFNKGGESTSGSNAFQSIKELLSIYFLNGGKILSKKWIMFIIRPLYYYISSRFTK